MTEEAKSNSGGKRLRRMAREPHSNAGIAPSQDPAAPVASPQSKASKVLELLARSEGATLDQLVEATCWLPHTTRAALTGLRKKGHVLTSDKVEGSPRIYRVVSDAVQSSPDVEEASAAETAA